MLEEFGLVPSELRLEIPKVALQGLKQWVMTVPKRFCFLFYPIEGGGVVSFMLLRSYSHSFHGNMGTC